MPEQIEVFDLRRKKYRGGYVTGFAVFLIAWLVRTILKIFELEMDTLHIILLCLLLLSAFYQAYHAIRLKYLEKDIRGDPFLKEALHNELVRLNELKAWKVAFFSVIVFIVLVGILSLTIHIRDTMLIVITTLLVGFGTFNTTVYILDR